MADVYVNALTTISTEPTTTDSLVAVNRNTNEGKIIDYNKLADAILNKIASKQYSGLNTTSKLLVGAINELDGDVSSLNSSLSEVSTAATRASKAILTSEVLTHGTSLTIGFSDYTTAALIFGAIHNASPFLYIYSNGYLAQVATTTHVAASISSDYKRVTITNTNAGLNGYLGVLCMPPTQATIS